MKAFPKFLLYLTLGLLAFSCKDEDPETDPAPLKALNKWQTAQVEIEQIATEIEALVRHTYPNGSNFLNCSSIENKITDEGLETTFTFSNAAPCIDGKSRMGKITMVTQNETNRVAFLHLDNYYINDRKIEGSFMLEMITVPGKTAVLHMLSINGRIVGPGNTNNIGFSIDRKSHQIAGFSTVYDTRDDVISLYEGEYSVILKDGAFEASIIEPLVVQSACPAPTNVKPLQGRILVELTTGQNSTVNFGDGTCSTHAYSE